MVKVIFVLNVLEWRVLHLILQEVPQVMQNKALILSRHGNDIDYLAAALCSMVRLFFVVLLYTTSNNKVLALMLSRKCALVHEQTVTIFCSCYEHRE
jgi:hypothetical protein